MGCILSYFSQGTYNVAEGQLTDKLLQGVVVEEHSNSEEKDEHADRATPDNPPSRDPPTSDDNTQDGVVQDDEAVLLGALGATAAGAVTVGAVAGKLKAEQDRNEVSAAGTDAASPSEGLNDAGVDDGAALPASAVGAGGVVAGAGGAVAAAESDEDRTSRKEEGSPRLVSGKSSPLDDGTQHEPAAGDERGDATSRAAGEGEADSSQTPEPAVGGEDAGEASSPVHSESAEPEETDDNGPSPTAGGRSSPLEDDEKSGARSAQGQDLPRTQSAAAKELQGPGESRPSSGATRQDSAPGSPAKDETSRPQSAGEGDYRVQTPSETGDSRVQSADAKDKSPAQSPVEGVESRSHYSTIGEESRVHSPLQNEDSRQLSAVIKDDSRIQSPAEAEDSRQQSAIVQDNSRIESPNYGEDSLQQSAVARDQFLSEVEDAGVQSAVDQSTAGEDSRPQTASVKEDAGLQSPTGDIGLRPQSSASGDDSVTRPRTGDEITRGESAAAESDSHAQSPTAGAVSQPDSEGMRDGSRVQSPGERDISHTMSAAAEDDAFAPGPIEFRAAVIRDDVPDQLPVVDDAPRPFSTVLEERSSIESPSRDQNSGLYSPSAKEDSRPHSADNLSSAANVASQGAFLTDQTFDTASKMTDDASRSPALDMEQSETRAETPGNVSVSPSRSETGAVSARSGEQSMEGTGDVAREDDPESAHGTAAMSGAESSAKSRTLSPEAADAPREVETPEVVPEQRNASFISEADQKTDEFLSRSSPAGEAGLRQETSTVTEDVLAETTNADAGDDESLRSEGHRNSGADGDQERQGSDDRVQSSVEAVFGSGTDVRDDVETIQTPIASVQEEPFVKVDRFASGSDEVPTPGSPAGETAAEAQQSEGNPPAGGVYDDSEPAVDPLAAAPAPPETPPSAGDSPRDRLTSATAADDTEAVLDASERTEDMEYDPLAQTQSVIFPEELEGRQSQQSEKPSTPFPEVEPPPDEAHVSPEKEQAATKIQAGVRGWQARRKISRQNAAATQIQAGFRGWKVRRERRLRRASSLPDMSQEAADTGAGSFMDVETLKNRAASKIQAGFRGWRTRQEMKGLSLGPQGRAERVSPAISMTDVSPEAQAAAKIQAGFRGWKTRKMLKRSLSDPNSEALVLAEGLDRRTVDEAGAARQAPTPQLELATPREEDDTAHSIQSIQSEVASGAPTPADSARSAAPPAAADARQEEAAAKIQAGFRGWKTRQALRGEHSSARPTDSAKSVTDSGALPTDYAIVHRPEDDWLTQDLMKLRAEKGGDAEPPAKSKDAADGAGDDDASTTESSSSWLTRAQTEIRASFQGLRDNVSDALRTVEDTAKMVRDKGAPGGADQAEVHAEDQARTVDDKGSVAATPGDGCLSAVAGGSGTTAAGESAAEAAAKGMAATPSGSDASSRARGEGGALKSPEEREEEEIWEEIQRHMQDEN